MLPICFQVMEAKLDANILGEQMNKGIHLEGQVGSTEKLHKIIPEFRKRVPTVSCPQSEDFQ